MVERSHLIDDRIDRARERLADDVNELEERLNIPLQIKRKQRDMLNTAREKIGMSPSSGNVNGSGDQSEAQALVSSVREHPLAALSIGYGARVLYNSWKHRHDSDVGQQARDLAGDAADQAEAVYERAGDKLQEAGEAIGERAKDVAERIPSDAQQVRRTVRSQPVGFGVAAFALGALVGLLGPRTRFEQQKAHDIREAAVDAAHGKAEEVKAAVETGVEEARKELSGDTAQDESGERPRRPGPILSSRQADRSGSRT